MVDYKEKERSQSYESGIQEVSDAPGRSHYLQHVSWADTKH
jgi:hypothetical protein